MPHGNNLNSIGNQDTDHEPKDIEHSKGQRTTETFSPRHLTILV